MKHALWLLLLLGGCFEDRYHCKRHLDCDLGEGGRCEVDDFCTLRDTRCDTLRRYAAHAGSLTDQCFDDRVVPRNACAGGQPPAVPEPGCFADVCERLKACCEVAWVDACVQIAQETPSCDLQCDTRIALTATRGATIERWDIRWSNLQWSSIDPRSDLSALAWVAPAPGSDAPRLSGATADRLVIGDTELVVPTGRTYQSITSIGFDRDRRDTIVTTYTGAQGSRSEVWKLDDQTNRELVVPTAIGLTWGEADRDTYPDAIAWPGAGQFNFLYNVQDDNFDHGLLNRGPGGLAGGGTPGTPQIRSFDWVDINRDGKLDVVMFGMEVRLHTAELGLGDPAAVQVDCDPPNAGRTCSTAAEPNLEAAAFAGTALPTAGAPSLVVSLFPGRDLFRIEPDGTVSAFPKQLPGAGCNCVRNCNMMTCPGPDCTCTYNCNQCVPVLAFVARDLDHDHQLDLVAIDARLGLYVAMAASGYQWSAATQVPTTAVVNFVSVDVSVSGAGPR